MEREIPCAGADSACYWQQTESKDVHEFSDEIHPQGAVLRNTKETIVEDYDVPEVIS